MFAAPCFYGAFVFGLLLVRLCETPIAAYLLAWGLVIIAAVITLVFDDKDED